MIDADPPTDWQVYRLLKVGNRIVRFYRHGKWFAWTVDGGLRTGYVDIGMAIAGAISWLQTERQRRYGE